MKRLFLSLLCATLCLTWQGVTAQESQYTTLPKFVDTSGAGSYTSELLTFEQPISGIRITYHQTTNGGTYNNYPYVYFGEIYITDTNGNDVSYTATTNSLASGDGDGLAALNDKDENTYYHSAYSSSHPIQPDGPVYLELTFSTPQSSFTYKHVKRPYNSNVPIYMTYSSLGETVTEAQPISNVETVKDEATSTLYINGKGAIPSYFYNLVDLTGIKNIVIGDGITSIGFCAFYSCSALTSITIPNSVTTIGRSAFYDCRALTSITIPNSVTSIGERAFHDCVALTNITIPNSVTTIGDQAFLYCYSLTSITIPNSVTTIGSEAFAYCYKLTSITIPNSVTSIGERAFQSCRSLTNITIPNSVTTIGSQAFYGCYALTSITVDANNPKYDSRDNCNAIIEKSTNTLIVGCKNTVIPNSVTTIGSYAFAYCDVLTSITIPNSVTTIGDNAFYDCDALTSITIPNSVTTIGNYAFSNCSALTSITIPNSVTTIGSSAFSECSALTSITIPNSVTTICDDAFQNCRALTSITIPNSVTTIGNYAFQNCSALTSITIPNSVTTIGYNAFSECSALTSITIGSGLTTFNNDIFSGCNNIKSITVDANNPKYDSRDNCNAIIETETNKMIFSCINTTIPNDIESFSLSNCHFVVPDNITTIKSGMFNGCDNVIIEVPSHVTKIESNAFGGYDITVILSDYISCENGSFNNVDNLICNSTEQILDQYNFKYNDYNNLCIPAGVTYNSNITNSFSNVIYGTKCGDYIYAYEVTHNDEKHLYIAGSGYTYSYDVSTAPWKEKEYYFVYLSSEITGVGSYALSYMYSSSSSINGVTSKIILPKGLQHIGNSAFYSNDLIKGALVIGNDVTSIGNNAFGGCDINSVHIGESLQDFSNDAFNTYNYSRCDISYITVDSNNKYLDSRDNCNAIIEKSTNTLIVGCKNTVIPNSVKTIGSKAFYDCNALTSITIPNSVTTIGSEAFYYCNALTSITIPNSVTTIGYYAFKNCNNLKEVEINATNIGDWFSGNRSINNIVIGKDAVTIGENAFKDCTGITSITIPNSVTTIGDKAFFGCSALKSITIPNSVTTIGIGAFYNCSALTSITIPNSVTTIDSSAFYGCNNLKEVEINAINIGDWFSYIKSINNIVIGKDVVTIGENAFKGCTGITSITIPNNVTTIGDNAFSGCSTLTSITIPNSVTTIGSNAFYYCSALTSITIPNSVTTIGSNAFYYCRALTSITIPNSVTTIGSNAFYGCINIKEVEINTTNIGSLFSGYTSINNVVIGKDAVTIEENAFKDCTGITSITIPNSVATIGSNAFYNCNALTSITIPNSVATIGSNAFNNASMVYVEGTTPATITTPFKSDVVIYVPDKSYAQYCKAEGWKDYLSRLTCEQYDTITVESEAESANSGIMAKIGVDYVGAVRSLKVTGSINSYDVIQFRDKMPLLHTLDLSETTVVASSKPFYEGNCTRDNNLGNYAFTGLTKLQSVKLPKGLTTIGDYMFNECSNLVSVEIPSTVESIGANAFYNCNKLKEVILPTTLNSLGAGAFYRCSNLKSIVIPNGVKTIKGSNYSYSATTFKECSSLESVTFPDGLEEIEGYAFRNCSKLKEIKLPPTVKNIGTGAFENNNSLTEIRIPSSVLTIGENAFSGCNNVKGVYTYTVEPTAISENTFSCFSSATLYVPSFSFYNYYWDEDGWKRFLSLQEFDEPYEYFYVNNDYTLNDDTGYIEGENGNNPDADINSGAGFIVEGEQSDNEDANQQLGDVNVNHDGEGNGGSIIGDNNLHIDNLNIKINVKGGRWYFFAFPFDIPLKNITMQNGSEYIFRYYDGEERAKKGNGGWKDINENHLKAARGYIFQCSANDVLILSIADLRVKKEDKFNELLAHVCDNLKDASWNFTGNPYLGYYDMSETDYTAPITVWDGEKYVAVRPGDDDYHFGPYEAFFVQKPEGKENVGFKGDQQMTGKQSKEKKERQAAARRARVTMGDIDRSRLIVNIELGNEESSDRTRIVFNERQTQNYETSCDAAKFESTGVPQIYTIDDENVHYAINERPAGTGVVQVGYSVAVDGVYTIEVPRMDTTVYLLDKKSNTLHSFLDGGYTFSSDAGKFEARFEILLNDNITGIENVENGSNGNETIYDLGGRKVKRTERGIYIINGEKSLVK